MPFFVYILSFGAFVLGTSEFMVAGMMPSLMEAFSISEEMAGGLVSLYALGMVVGGPVLAGVLTREGVSGKRILLGAMGIYAVAQCVAALGDDYGVMAASRFVAGIVASACLGTSLAMSIESVGAAVSGKASAVVLTGLMLSPVLGVPLAMFIDQFFGWRASFLSVAAGALLCAVLIAFLGLRDVRSSRTAVAHDVPVLKSGLLWGCYILGCLLIGATFAGFSFFSVILSKVSGFSSLVVPWVLGAYGVANVLGNAFFGRFSDGSRHGGLVWGIGIMAFSFLIFACFADAPVVAVVCVLLIGCTGVSMNPSVLSLIGRVVQPNALVSTLYVSVVNVGLAGGAWISGWGVDEGYGLNFPLWVGFALSLFALFFVLFLLRRIDRS